MQRNIFRSNINLIHAPAMCTSPPVNFENNPPGFQDLASVNGSTKRGGVLGEFEGLARGKAMLSIAARRACPGILGRAVPVFQSRSFSDGAIPGEGMPARSVCEWDAVDDLLTRGRKRIPVERQGLKNAKRVVVKVGTAVVSNSDGTLALSRLGALVEQVLCPIG